MLNMILEIGVAASLAHKKCKDVLSVLALTAVKHVLNPNSLLPISPMHMAKSEFSVLLESNSRIH